MRGREFIAGLGGAMAWRWWRAPVGSKVLRHRMSRSIRAVPFVAAIFFALGSAVAQNNFLITTPEPQLSAWWLRTAFYPFEKEVRRIPVRKIRSTWCKATEFRKELFPEDFQSDIANSGLSFAVDGIFDGSKANQTALVGVYETCNHERGTFLLVLAWQKNGLPTIRFVHEMPIDRQFAILKVSEDASTLMVFHCMECDHISPFKWDRSKRRFRPIHVEDMD